MKKLNKKGFTLIELIAVIVILSIILVFVVPNLLDTYKRSKLKTEKAFVDQLSKGIESYITLYSNEMSFSKVDGNFVKEITDNRSDKPSYDVDVYKADITVKDIIDKNIIESSEYINPGNRGDNTKQCKPETDKITVYRDSDFVYCFKMEPMDCLTEDFIDLLTEEKPEEPKNKDGKIKYVLDTCIWKKIENGE